MITNRLPNTFLDWFDDVFPWLASVELLMASPHAFPPTNFSSANASQAGSLSSGPSPLLMVCIEKSFLISGWWGWWWSFLRCRGQLEARWPHWPVYPWGPRDRGRKIKGRVRVSGWAWPWFRCAFGRRWKPVAVSYSGRREGRMPHPPSSLPTALLSWLSSHSAYLTSCITLTTGKRAFKMINKNIVISKGSFPANIQNPLIPLESQGSRLINPLLPSGCFEGGVVLTGAVCAYGSIFLNIHEPSDFVLSSEKRRQNGRKRDGIIKAENIQWGVGRRPGAPKHHLPPIYPSPWRQVFLPGQVLLTLRVSSSI